MGFRNAFRFTRRHRRHGLHRRLRPRRRLREPEPRARRPGRVERDQAARQLWLAVLRRRQRRLQRLRLRHQHVGREVQLRDAGQRLTQQHGQARPAAVDRRPTSSTATASRRPGRSSARARRHRWPARSTTTTRARRRRRSGRSTSTASRCFYEWGRNFIQEWPLAADGKVLTMNRVLYQHRLPVARWTCSSAPTARCTCSSGAAASAATTRTRACTGSTTPPTAARRRRGPRARRTPAALRSRCSSPAPARWTVTATRSATAGTSATARPRPSPTRSTPTPRSATTRPGSRSPRSRASAKTGTATVPIIVGNTRPTVTISAPPDGGFFEWGDEPALAGVRHRSRRDRRLRQGDRPAGARATTSTPTRRRRDHRVLGHGEARSSTKATRRRTRSGSSTPATPTPAARAARSR